MWVNLNPPTVFGTFFNPLSAKKCRNNKNEKDMNLPNNMIICRKIHI